MENSKDTTCYIFNGGLPNHPGRGKQCFIIAESIIHEGFVLVRFSEPIRDTGTTVDNTEVCYKHALTVWEDDLDFLE